MSSRSFLQRNAVQALCAVLLLLAVTWPVPTLAAKPMTAILLVARADVSDPDFGESVVLVMNNLGDAPAGLIINKPTRLEVSQLFPGIKALAQLHDKVYFGGPVELETVWFLFRATTAPEHAIQACDGVYVSADRDLLMKLLGRAHPMEGLRIFLGHSGWSPGQLQGEIGRGDWRLERANPTAIFGGEPEHLWPPVPDEVPKGST